MDDMMKKLAIDYAACLEASLKANEVECEARNAAYEASGKTHHALLQLKKYIAQAHNLEQTMATVKEDLKKGY